MGLITEEGVYSISQEDYHADPVTAPSFSASVAHTLLESTAMHAWGSHPRLNPNFKRTSADHLDFGELAHALMLGDERNLGIIEAADWKKKETRELRDKYREEGKIPTLRGDFDRAKVMVDFGRKQIDMHEDVCGAFRTGQAEISIIWREPVPDRKREIWCRCRLDFLHGTNFEYQGGIVEGRDWQRLDLSRFQRAGNVFPDYKTTQRSAHVDVWGKGPLFDHGNDLRAAFYGRGIKKIFDVPSPHYTFIVQETRPPFALNVIAPEYPVIDRANDNLDRALDYWAWCCDRGWWPGYPKKTCYAPLRPWQMHEWEDQQAFKRALSIEEKNEIFAANIAAQAPLGIEAEVNAGTGEW